MWELGEERPDFVLRNMVGASIDVIVTKVERTANRAQASRRQACRSQRRFFAARGGHAGRLRPYRRRPLW